MLFTEAQLPSLYHAYSEDGFDDGELRHLITGIVNTPDYRPYLRPLWRQYLALRCLTMTTKTQSS